MANQSFLHASTGVGAYTGEEVKEDVLQLIYQITPEDTPGLVMFGRSKATNPKHEWLVRERGSRVGIEGVHQKVAPGDVFETASTGSATVPDATDPWEQLATPTREANFCEIFRVLPRVDETTLAVNFHGISDIMADQVEFRAADFAIYIENQLWNGTIDDGPESGTTAEGWEMAGLTSVITDNVFTANGAAITDAMVQNVFNKCWVDGGRPQDMFMGPSFKCTMIDALGSGVTKFVDQSERGIINTLSYYEGATQSISLHLTRDLDDRTRVDSSPTVVDNRAMLLDRSAIKLAWLREPFMERLPRVAGDERVRIEGQVTLEYGSQKSHGEINDIEMLDNIGAEAGE